MATPENSTFLFFDLPAELQLEVAGWLSIRGLGTFAQLSQLCNEYASSNTIWKRYFSDLIDDGDIDYAIERLQTLIKIEPKYSDEVQGYYKALYFRYLACEKHQCPNCVARKVGGGWSGGALCRACFKEHGSMMIVVKSAMHRFSLTHEEVSTHVHIDSYLSPERGVPTEYCYEYRALLVALAKWGSFEAVRRNYIDALKKLPKSKPKEKRTREETVVEDEPDPKKRRSGRLSGRGRVRYVDDVDIF
jgi:tetratricopeptide (TPR) repeat protein